MYPFIQDLAVILGLAFVVGWAFQKIKQPLVLGYLLAGIIAGPYTPPFSLILDMEGVHIWSELGVIFLMFSLGLEFSFKRLLAVGLTATITGPFEAVFMLTAGFLTGKIAGWSPIDCVFLGAILAISSTTIIIKALDELGLKKERFAELVFGVLVVEDLVGILLLTSLSTLTSPQGISMWALVGATAKLLLIVGACIGIGLLTVPKLINYVGEKTTDEVLLVLAVGLCLGFVVGAAYFHYSAALGAFLMGSLIAESKELHRIERLILPVRDLFAAVFFVSIGMLLNPTDVLAQWRWVLLISFVTVLGKLVSTTVGALLTKQPFKTSVQVGFSLAQIGEFSFIIAGLGLSLGVMNPMLYSLAISVSVVTTFTTPYLIRFGKRIAA
ncbi:MAG TPA: cation:proton antiporter [Opitutaceae bacterium]|nr:cation:proton antiporter [Opitutaceae bacterium]